MGATDEPPLPRAMVSCSDGERRAIFRNNKVSPTPVFYALVHPKPPPGEAPAAPAAVRPRRDTAPAGWPDPRGLLLPAARKAGAASPAEKGSPRASVDQGEAHKPGPEAPLLWAHASALHAAPARAASHPSTQLRASEHGSPQLRVSEDGRPPVLYDAGVEDGGAALPSPVDELMHTRADTWGAPGRVLGFSDATSAPPPPRLGLPSEAALGSSLATQQCSGLQAPLSPWRGADDGIWSPVTPSLPSWDRLAPLAGVSDMTGRPPGSVGTPPGDAAALASLWARAADAVMTCSSRDASNAVPGAAAPAPLDGGAAEVTGVGVAGGGARHRRSLPGSGSWDAMMSAAAQLIAQEPLDGGCDAVPADEPGSGALPAGLQDELSALLQQQHHHQLHHELQEQHGLQQEYDAQHQSARFGQHHEQQHWDPQHWDSQQQQQQDLHGLNMLLQHQYHHHHHQGGSGDGDGGPGAPARATLPRSAQAVLAALAGEDGVWRPAPPPPQPASIAAMPPPHAAGVTPPAVPLGLAAAPLGAGPAQPRYLLPPGAVPTTLLGPGGMPIAIGPDGRPVPLVAVQVPGTGIVMVPADTVASTPGGGVILVPPQASGNARGALRKRKHHKAKPFTSAVVQVRHDGAAAQQQAVPATSC
eukprot:365338-Chlamydomonas_euryale.AAC.37